MNGNIAPFISSTFVSQQNNAVNQQVNNQSSIMDKNEPNIFEKI
jgi:hypothetical protein